MGNRTVSRFTFRIFKMNKKTPPFDPVITLTLDTYFPTEDGVPAISQDLTSEKEIDDYIRCLKDDLSAVGMRAKAALRKAQSEASER